MNIETFAIPSIISTFIGGVFILLIRKIFNDQKEQFFSRLKDIENTMNQKYFTLDQRVSKIQEEYVSEEKHRLICGMNALEFEKLFKQCLEGVKDDIFTNLRDTQKNFSIELEKIKKAFSSELKDALKEVKGDIERRYKL